MDHNPRVGAITLSHLILENALGAVRADIRLALSPFSERPLKVSEVAALEFSPLTGQASR